MKVPLSRSSMLRTGRYQSLIAALLIAVQAAFVLRLPILGPVNTSIVVQTAALCFLATVAGIILIKSLGRYPGVEESSYAFVGLAASYGLLLLILLMLRVPYSRSLIASSFLTNALAISLLYAALRRETKLCIGLIPEGPYRDIMALPNVEWRILEDFDSNTNGVDAISVDLRSDIPDEWDRRLATFALEGVPVYDLKHLRESLTGKVQIEHLSENSLGTLSPLYAWMTIKHLLDWVLAFVALLLLLPFFALLALAIRLDSAGPVLFRQTRIGYRGQPFRVYKLRTMTVAAPDDGAASGRDAAMTKDGDHRVTRIGRFLRQSRIDELPQLINVLKGEMSWIGPRPEAQVLSQWYESEIPFYRYRHIVRPGITGWAQVNQGHVADVANVTEKLHYDFYYIKHFSLWLDLIIVGRTIQTMITGFGAR